MTNDYRLGEMESRFADMLWRNCPMKSNAMIKLAEEELKWKRPTTYTVLRKFIDRGMFRNENAMVTALVTREEFYAGKSTDFVEKSFSGSLPNFLTAFGSRKKLSSKEIDELKKFIEEQERKEEES